MSIRITQSMIYDNYVSQMQTSLGAYMNSAEQGSTQKKINAPSDDPSGTYKILNLRNSTTYNKQLLSNCDTAKGWLELEDSVLATQVPTVITSIKELAEQAATGTYTAEQRLDIAYQVRQQFGSLINMANTEFDGKNLFAGHKYDGSAFQEGLALSSRDAQINEQIKQGNFIIEGNTDLTVAFQFTENGTLSKGRSFRWTNDGGKTWKEGTVDAAVHDGENYVVMSFDGVSARIREDKASTINVTKTDQHEEGVGRDNGTLYIRPTAIYMGDVQDKINLTPMGINKLVFGEKTRAQGTFSGNTLVRFPEGVSSAVGSEFKWSYSTDNGMNWVEAKATVGSPTTRLPLPEGYLDLELDGNIPANGQIMIHPEDASVDYEIMQGTFITVNGVGKDIFGGYFKERDEDDGVYKLKPALGDLADGRNLFEVVGDLIGYLETNCQDGCQEALVKLTRAEEHILTQSTKVGGLENRVEVAYNVLNSQKLDIQERLSYVEDIDLTELLVKMQQQQITYQTVLQSASKIMNMSLANYI
ncbi:MAG: flagellar hook protein [Desulfovibrio sp.]|nr:flagellar hook protein [Desulfovibrio sp.]